MKKLSILASIGVMAISTGVMASAPTTQPVIPVDQIPVPAARTVAVASVAYLPASVLVFGFQPLGDATKVSWVGQALQESMVADLSRVTDLHPTSAVGNEPSDSAAAIARAKAAGLDAVIIGDFQANGAQMRFTGQVLSVANGQALGGLKASGDFRDLFSMEDDLGKQVERILRPSPVSSQVVALTKADENAQIFNGGDVGMSEDQLDQSLEVQQQFQDDYDRYVRTPAYYDDWGSCFGLGFGFGGGYYNNYPLEYFPHPGWGFAYGAPIGWPPRNPYRNGNGGGGKVTQPVGHTPAPITAHPPPGVYEPL